MENIGSNSLHEEFLEQEPEGYYERKIEEMKAGKVVWVRRNFEGDAGLCIDLYNGTHLAGYVDCEFDNPYSPALGFGAVAYIPGPDGPELLDPEGPENPTAPAVAAFDLMQYCRRRGLLD